MSSFRRAAWFSIGGFASGWTELNRAFTQTLLGMVTFNMKTKVFPNGTSNLEHFNQKLANLLAR